MTQPIDTQGAPLEEDEKQSPTRVVRVEALRALFAEFLRFVEMEAHEPAAGEQVVPPPALQHPGVPIVRAMPHGHYVPVHQRRCTCPLKNDALHFDCHYPECEIKLGPPPPPIAV